MGVIHRRTGVLRGSTLTRFFRYQHSSGVALRFAAHPPQAPLLLAVLLTVAVVVPTPALGQDANPLDRLVDPEEGPTMPIVQSTPSPRAPSPRAPSPRAPSPPHTSAPRAPNVVGYDETSQPRTGLVVGGSLMLGLAYGIPLSIAAATDFRNETTWLAVPVVGPWITIGRMRFGSCRNRRFVAESCDDSGERAADVLGAVAMGFTGVIQAGGLAMLVTGVAAQKTKLVPVYAIVPMPVPGGVGLAATGSF